MKLKANCEHCNTALSLSADLLGKKVKCPSCTQSFVVSSVRNASSKHSLESAPQAAVVSQANSGDGAPQSAEGKESGRTNASAPKLIGRFELRRVLGQGGFGRVYRAYDPQLDREVALKVPTFGPGDSAKAKRFRDEAKAAARLRHPNIVPTFDSGTSGNLHFIASQFIEGQPLSELIDDGRLDLENAVRWVSRLARALEYAHGMGIVHRDVKPQNVMLDARSEPQLMDFGLAKRLNDDSGLTADGAILGTPAYMSPEQATGATDEIGPATDQYSLGAILYELLTGQRPFSGAPHVVLAKIASEDPPSIRSLNPQVPQDLVAITEKAMRKEIRDRYANCGEFADDLERWLAGDATLARPLSLYERYLRWTKRNKKLATAAGVAAVALVSAAVLGTSFAGYFAYSRIQIGKEQRNTLKALEQAEAERELAAEQSRLAQSQTRIVQQQTDRAEKNLKLAEERRVAEEKQRKLADQRLKEAQANAYVANIRMAVAKWEANDIAGMNAALDGLRPKDGEPDRRGWEWNYLWNLSHSDLLTLDVGRTAVGVSRDGQFIASRDRNGTMTVRSLRTREVVSTLGTETGYFGGASVPAFNADGSLVAIVEKEAGIGIWETLTGKRRYLIPFPDLPPEPRSGTKIPAFSMLAFSPDGTRVAAAGENAHHQLHLFDVRTQKKLWSSEVFNEFYSICFSPDGRKILSVNGPIGTAAGVWDAGTGRRERFLGEGKVIRGVDWHPDGKTVALSSQGLIEIVNPADGKIVKSITEDTVTGGSVRFSADGKRLVIAEKILRVWDLESDARPLLLKGHAGIAYRAVFSSDGRRIISSGLDGVVKVWDALSGVSSLGVERLPLDPALNPEWRISGAEFSNDGRTIRCLGGGAPPTWDLESGKIAAYLKLPVKQGFLYAVEMYSPDEQTVLGRLSPPGTVLGWQRESGNQAFAIPGMGATTSGPTSSDSRLYFYLLGKQRNPTGNRIAVRRDGESGVIRILDASSGSEISRFNTEILRVGKKTMPLLNPALVVFSPDGEHLAMAGGGAVIVWNVATASLERALLGRPNTSGNPEYSRDGRLIAYAATPSSPGDAAASMIQIWDAQSGSEVSAFAVQPGSLDPHPYVGSRLHFVDDNRRLVSRGTDGIVRVWDTSSGQELLALSGPFGTPSIDVSPDGATILAVTTDGTISRPEPMIGQSPGAQAGVMLWDGRPESRSGERAVQRAARSTVAYFREKTKTQAELVAAIKQDPTINEDVRSMAARFAGMPPPKIIELQP